MKKRKNTALILICSILASITIFVSIETSVNGMQVSKLGAIQEAENEKKKINEFNFVKLGSVKNLESKSQDLGFVKSDNFVYIKVDGPVALSK